MPIKAIARSPIGGMIAPRCLPTDFLITALAPTQLRHQWLWQPREVHSDPPGFVFAEQLGR